MTLRDIGTWFTELWRSILDGFQVALTQGFWDWPLWISIPAVIIIPWAVLALIRAGQTELREGQLEPLSLTVGFGVATALCALVTFDLFVTETIFQNGNKATAWLRIGYPIMTTFFGLYFLISIGKRRRH